MSGDIDIHHLGAAYALDALDERERMAFEAHYPNCDVCRRDVQAFRSTLAHVAAAQSAVPPAALKASVMAEIARTRQLSPIVPDRVAGLADVSDLSARRRQRVIGGLVAAAAAVVLVVAGLVVVGRDGAPSYAASLTQVMEAPDGKVMSLEAGESMSDGATVKVAWSEAEGMAVFMADGLPATDDGMAYELWFIDDEGPQPMGMLAETGDGELHAVVDIEGAPAAWGVTVEPESGSTAPTGDILFLGTA